MNIEVHIDQFVEINFPISALIEELETNSIPDSSRELLEILNALVCLIEKSPKKLIDEISDSGKNRIFEKLTETTERFKPAPINSAI